MEEPDQQLWLIHTLCLRKASEVCQLADILFADILFANILFANKGQELIW